MVYLYHIFLFVLWWLSALISHHGHCEYCYKNTACRYMDFFGHVCLVVGMLGRDVALMSEFGNLSAVAGDVLRSSRFCHLCSFSWRLVLQMLGCRNCVKQYLVILTCTSPMSTDSEHFFPETFWPFVRHFWKAFLFRSLGHLRVGCNYYFAIVSSPSCLFFFLYTETSKCLL